MQLKYTEKARALISCCHLQIYKNTEPE